MFIKPKVPWHYLIWKEANLSAEHEIALARLTRRRGIFYMLRLYWGVVTGENDRYNLGCFWIFAAYNYPPFLCSAGYFLGLVDCGILGGAWLITWAIGTTRYLGWLIWLLNRWPPLASG
jgi:hypothetical protein